MEFQTQRGLKYEVPETQNFFSEVVDERPRLSPELVASLVVRLENEIQSKEFELQEAYMRLKTRGEQNDLNGRRIAVLEDALDETNERLEVAEVERYNAIQTIKEMQAQRGGL